MHLFWKSLFLSEDEQWVFLGSWRAVGGCLSVVKHQVRTHLSPAMATRKKCLVLQKVAWLSCLLGSSIHTETMMCCGSLKTPASPSFTIPMRSLSKCTQQDLTPLTSAWEVSDKCPKSLHSQIYKSESLPDRFLWTCISRANSMLNSFYTLHFNLKTSNLKTSTWAVVEWWWWWPPPPQQIAYYPVIESDRLLHSQD